MLNRKLHNSDNYLPWLDGIRGVAIVFVLLHHTFGAKVPFGFLGVDVFFVLSGYVIYRSYFSRPEFKLGTFYWRRIARLYPALVAVVLVNWLTPSLDFMNSRELYLKTLFYYKNFGVWNWPLGPYWSLSAEEQFYIGMGILIFLFRKQKKLLMIPLAIYFLYVTNRGIHQGLTFNDFNSPQSLYLVYYRPAEILLGVGLAALPQQLTSRRRPLYWLFCNPITVGFLLYTTFLKMIPTAAALLTVSWLLSLAAGDQKYLWMRKIMSNPILVKLGVLSYSIYIWHVTIMVLNPVGARGGLYWHAALTNLFILIAAAASYTLLEMPAQRALLQIPRFITKFATRAAN